MCFPQGSVTGEQTRRGRAILIIKRLRGVREREVWSVELSDVGLRVIIFKAIKRTRENELKYVLNRSMNPNEAGGAD